MSHAPLRSSVHFYDDERMAASACSISKALEKVGVTGAYDAFTKLRPPAYKADLWRLSGFLSLPWAVPASDLLKNRRPARDS